MSRLSTDSPVASIQSRMKFAHMKPAPPVTKIMCYVRARHPAGPVFTDYFSSQCMKFLIKDGSVKKDFCSGRFSLMLIR